MKALLIILILIISTSVQAQDTTRVKMPPDSASIISLALVYDFIYKLGDRIQMPDKTIFQLTPNERDKINYLIQVWMIDPAIIEWNKKKKK